jgi:hypothetical protein
LARGCAGLQVFDLAEITTEVSEHRVMIKRFTVPGASVSWLGVQAGSEFDALIDAREISVYWRHHMPVRHGRLPYSPLNPVCQSG